MAGNIRAGGAFLEMIADSSKFQAGLSQVSSMLDSFGRTLNGIGFGLSGIGASIGAPLAVMSRAFLAVADDVGGKRIETVFGVKFKNDKASGEKLKADLAALGGVADDTMVDLASTTRDGMRVMGETVRVMMASIGAALAPSMQQVAIIVSASARAVSELASKNPQLIAKLGTIATVLAVVGGAFATLGFGVIFVSTVITGLLPLLAAAKFVAIGTVIGALALAVTGLGGSFLKMIPAVSAWSSKLLDLISEGDYQGAFKLLADSARAVGQQVGAGLMSMFQSVVGFIKMVADAGIPVISHLFSFILGASAATSKFMSDAFGESVKTIVKLFKSGNITAAWEVVTETIKHAWLSLTTEIAKVWVSLFPVLLNALSSFLGAIDAGVGGLRKAAIAPAVAFEEAESAAATRNAAAARKQLENTRREMAKLDDQFKFTVGERKNASLGIAPVGGAEREAALRSLRDLFAERDRLQKEFESSDANKAASKARLDSLREQLAEIDDSNPFASIVKSLDEASSKALEGNVETFATMNKDLDMSKKKLDELIKRRDELVGDGKFTFGLDKYIKLFEDFLADMAKLRDTRADTGKAIAAVGSFSAFEAAIIGGQSLDPVVLEAKKHTRLLDDIKRLVVGPPRFK